MTLSLLTQVRIFWEKTKPIVLQNCTVLYNNIYYWRMKFEPKANEGYHLVRLKFVMGYHSLNSVKDCMKAVSTTGFALLGGCQFKDLEITFGLLLC